ncbi:hypothetical protein TorRG33x02_275300, partial [Trema orientale]
EKLENTTQDFKQIKTFVLLNDQLYKKLGDVVLARYVSSEFGKNLLRQVHDKVCGLQGPSLARRIQRLGYFWPELNKEAVELQRSCEQCQLTIDIRENYCVEKEDWRHLH